MWWSNLFVDMNKANFFNFSFLPKYAVSFVRGLEYTLLLAVVSVLLAIIPALLLALMRLSKNRLVKAISGAYYRDIPLDAATRSAIHHLFRPVRCSLHPAHHDPRLCRHLALHPRRCRACAQQLSLRRGDLPRRHSRRRPGADRSRPLARPFQVGVYALYRPAAGDQKRTARARQ